MPTRKGTSSASLRTAAPDRRPHTAVTPFTAPADLSFWRAGRLADRNLLGSSRVWRHVAFALVPIRRGHRFCRSLSSGRSCPQVSHRSQRLIQQRIRQTGERLMRHRPGHPGMPGRLSRGDAPLRDLGARLLPQPGRHPAARRDSRQRPGERLAAAGLLRAFPPPLHPARPHPPRAAAHVFRQAVTWSRTRDDTAPQPGHAAAPG